MKHIKLLEDFIIDTTIYESAFSTLGSVPGIGAPVLADRGTTGDGSSDVFSNFDDEDDNFTTDTIDTTGEEPGEESTKKTNLKSFNTFRGKKLLAKYKVGYKTITRK